MMPGVSVRPRRGRGLAGQAGDLHLESLAFDGDLDKGMGQFTNFDGVPVFPNSDPKCGCRQPRFPRVRERSCSRRPYMRQGLTCKRWNSKNRKGMSEPGSASTARTVSTINWNRLGLALPSAQKRPPVPPGTVHRRCRSGLLLVPRSFEAPRPSRLCPCFGRGPWAS